MNPASSNGGEIIRFQTNVPVELPGIKYPGGRPVQGQYGDQVLITFVDGRKAYFPPIVETRIQDMGLRCGEPLVICKREVTEGRRKMIRWEVLRQTGEEEETPLERDLKASIVHARKEMEALKPAAPAAAQAQSVVRPQTKEPQKVASTPSTAPVVVVTSKGDKVTMQSHPTPSTGNGLANALKFAIDAAAEATAYAQSKGMVLAFDSDSIRTLAVTAFIQSNGGRS